MVFKGLLIVLGGLIFIFSSGVPMRLISQFRPDYKREGLYWGIGIWIAAFFLSNFVMNLVRQIMSAGSSSAQAGSAPGDLPTYLFGTILTTLLLQWGMLIFLKNRHKKDEDIKGYGLAMGFGVGVIDQVLTGMILITAGAGVIFKGAGIQLALGDLRTDLVEVIAAESLFNVAAVLLALVLFRVALLTIRAVQGYLVANSMLSKKIFFWLAAAVFTGFAWFMLLLQLALKMDNPGQLSLGVTPAWASIMAACYYLIAFILGYRWLTRTLQSEQSQHPSKRRKS